MIELPGEQIKDGYGIHAATAFRAADGQMIVEYPWRWWAYSPDGVSFRELSTVCRLRSREKGVSREVLAYEDPYAARTGWLFVRWSRASRDVMRDPKPVQVELDGIGYDKVDAPNRIMLLSLPPMSMPSHVYLRPSASQLVYLSLRRYAEGGGAAYGGIRADNSEALFVGDVADLFSGGIAELAEREIDRPLPDTIDQSVIRYPTATGTLDVPEGESITNRRVATWDGEPLVELMLARLLVVETLDRVRLCLNPGHSSWDTNTHSQPSDTAWDRLRVEP